MACSWGTYTGLQRKHVHDYKEEMFRREFEKAIHGSQYGDSAPLKKMKRFRSAFTTEQVNYLEKEFNKYPYIGNSRRKDVSSALDIPERAVKIWFQNRRMKQKKDVLNKDIDVEEQKNVKNDVASVQLSNISDLPSTNDQSSLPIIAAANESAILTNVDKNLKDSDVIQQELVTKSTESKFLEDEARNRDLMATKVTCSSSGIKTNISTSTKTSADFSIELLKKYKNESSESTSEPRVKLAKEKNFTTSTRDIRRSPLKENHFKTELQNPRYMPTSSIPEDLSSNKPNEVEFRQPVCNKPVFQPQQRNPETVNNIDVPLYLKGFYTQPYIPPGNMIWKPVDVAPVITPRIPAVIPNINYNTLSGTHQQSVPRRNCSCDCHVTSYPSPILIQPSNPTPQVQYVITAVPYQNTAAAKYSYGLN